jgi:hypothetical protein
MKFDPEEAARALSLSWSVSSARQWSAQGDHFYNRIGGRRYDFTESQFAKPISYLDVPATRDEAERFATRSELTALRGAFAHYSRTSG